MYRLQNTSLIIPFNFALAPNMAAFAVKTPSFLVYFIINILINFEIPALSEPQVPCFFIFGDSLVDNGNNNELPTEAKVNYQPYGIDFPQGPTGRFTNGRTIADIIAERLGFETYIPPFATAQGTDHVTRGVNYASGSAGIRNETGKQLGENISLDRQLLNHNLIISQIIKLFGNYSAANNHLSKCLYFFIIGSNDYLNNYFLPEYYNTSSEYTPEEYATALVQQYSQDLTTLYNLGARKIAVSALGPLGCIPQVAKRGSCDQNINAAANLFNGKLEDLVNELNDKISDAKFQYVGIPSPSSSELLSRGISILSTPCCKVSNRTGQCIEGEEPCTFRALHAFYDNFHPTETINSIVGIAAYISMLGLIA